MHSIPNFLLGVMATSAADGNHRIGIEIELSGESRESGDGTLCCPVEYRLFVDPPTINVGEAGTLKVNLTSRSVQLVSESRLFQFNAEFSKDFQMLRGRADVENFQLMDVAGTFRDCEMALQADDAL